MAVEDHIKGTVITLVWITGFAGVLFPLRLKMKGEALLSYTICFSAGVILSVAFCHLLPDSAEDLEEVSKYPLANLLCCLGFFAVLFGEKVLAGPHQAVVVDEVPSHPHHGHSTTATRPPGMRRTCSTDVLLANCTPTSPDLEATTRSYTAWDTTGHPKDCTMTDHHHHVAYTSKEFRKGLESGLQYAKHMHTEVNTDVKYTERDTAVWVPVTLLVVLSFHSVIEGLALGAAQRETDFFVITVAILSHKFLAALSLGISFLRCSISGPQHVTYAFVFSSMTPVGALLGVFISGILDAAFINVFAAACQALGSGTFIYISLMEFLPEELSGKELPLKLLCTFAGFGLMALVAIWV